MASYASQCFPARSLTRFKRNSDGGAWLVQYREEQKRRFEAVLLPSSDRQATEQKNVLKHSHIKREKAQTKCNELNGIYLLRELRVDDPSDLASINVIGKELITAKKEDFVLFDNVVDIEAGENRLTMDAFKTFPNLRKLEVQLNNIRNLNFSNNDFQHLEVLDLSYNNITESGIIMLGVLPVLKRLHLTGNGLRNIPMEIATTYKLYDRNEEKIKTKKSFGCLEELHLNENEFEDYSVFSRLANLHRLKVLNLSKNCLKCVPHLRVLSAQKRIETISADKDRAENVDISHMLDNSLSLESENDMEMNKKTESPDLDEAEKATTDSSSNDDALDLDFPQAEPRYPFVSLEKLDISYNEIDDEDALLPLAIWPSLRDVDVWENPLIKNNKGIPAFLNYHLSTLCGITLNRKEPNTAKKPSFVPSIVPAVKYNKVDDIMPPTRRTNLLMLEFESYEAALQNGSLYGKPLPPISKDSDSTQHNNRMINTAPARSKNTESDHTACTDSQRPHSVERDQFFDQGSLPQDTRNAQPITDHKLPKGNESDGVFLTQIDGWEDNSPKNYKNHETSDCDINCFQRKDDSNDINHFPELSDNPLSYEDLLKIEGPLNEIDTPPVADIKGNINALRHALDHPLIFTDAASSSTDRQIYTQHNGAGSASSKRATKRDKVQTALNQMRENSSIVEENLDTVLERYDTDPQMRQTFPEVKKLLKEVQSKYNKVRVASLETASNAQKLLKNSPKPTQAKKLDGNTLNSQIRRKNLSQRTKNIPTTKSDLFTGSDNVEKTMKNFKTLVDKRI